MIEISKKTDVLIPFSQIGEDGWKENTERIIKSLLDNWDGDMSDIAPKTDEEINQLEKRLGTTLPEGLRMFYKTFGIADIGEQLQDFDEIGRLSDIWDIALEPYYGPDFTENELQIYLHLITFSDYIGNGNMFCFHDETKEIYYFDHDTRPYLTKFFDSADDYLKGCLIECQGDLFDVEVGEEQVREWIEEIMIDIFGKQTYTKWYY